MAKKKGTEDGRESMETGMTRENVTIEFLEPNWARLFTLDAVVYLSPMLCAQGPLCIDKIKSWEKDEVGKRRVYCANLPEPGVDALRFVSVDKLLFPPERWGARDFGPFTGNLIEYLARILILFKKRADEWVMSNKKDGRNLHDCSYWLPVPRHGDPPGLADYLMRWRKTRLEPLNYIAHNWRELNYAQRGLAPLRIINDVKAKFLSSYVKGSKHSGLAAEACGAGYPQEKYAALEERWLKSLGVPPAFPSICISHGELVGRFLRREEPAGLFLGVHSNCCQYPGSNAESSAWHGQEDPLGGFFIVRAKRGIVAQSWTWIANGQACFDSVESKGLDETIRPAVAEIYRLCAAKLIEHGFTQVRVGCHEKLKLEGLTKAADVAVTPTGAYSDAKNEQWIVA